MSREEIDKWYWEMEEILVHNHNRLGEYVIEEYDNLFNIFREKIRNLS
jgi:hypothetical protein